MNTFISELKQRKNLTLIIGFILSLFILVGVSGTSDKKTTEVKSTGEVKGISEEKPKEVPKPKQEEPKQLQLYKVIKVIDGDTVNVEVNGKKESVRLIGIDSPETKDPRKPVQCFGAEASTKLSGMLNKQSVELVPDETQDDKDKYGRLLRYIFIKDGVNVNKLMVEEGYAFEYTYHVPYKYQDEFKKAEKMAREKQVGLWAENTCAGNRETKAPEVKGATTENQTPPPIPKVVPVPVQNNSAYTCNCSKTCGQMATCDEAYYQLNNCGCSKRDLDGDGVLCESLCR